MSGPLPGTLGYAHLVDELPVGAELVGGPACGTALRNYPGTVYRTADGSLYREDGSTSSDGRRKRLFFCPEVASGV